MKELGLLLVWFGLSSCVPPKPTILWHPVTGAENTQADLYQCEQEAAQ